METEEPHWERQTEITASPTLKRECPATPRPTNLAAEGDALVIDDSPERVPKKAHMSVRKSGQDTRWAGTLVTQEPIVQLQGSQVCGPVAIASLAALSNNPFTPEAVRAWGNLQGPFSPSSLSAMMSGVRFGAAKFRKNFGVCGAEEATHVRDALRQDGYYLLCLDGHAVGLRRDGGVLCILDSHDSHVRCGTALDVQREVHRAERVLLIPLVIGGASGSSTLSDVDAGVLVGADTDQRASSLFTEVDFANSESFLKNIVHTCPDHVPWKQHTLSCAVNVFKHYGVLPQAALCPQCGMGYIVLRFGGHKNPCFWGCSTSLSHKHLALPLNIPGPLSTLHPSSWCKFVHFMIAMRTNMRWGNVHSAIADTYGSASSETIQRWYVLYTTMLEKYLVDVDGLKVGGDGEVVAVDETFMRRQRMGKGLSNADYKVRGSNKKATHIAKRLPGKTVWKRPATRAMHRRPASSSTSAPACDKPEQKPKPCLKRPACMKRPSAAPQRWVWGAVEVGRRGDAPKSHRDGSKRIHMQLLPDQTSAPDGKPRGVMSLANAMMNGLHDGSLIIADEWAATPAAAASRGVEVEGRVCHADTFRDQETGIHTNDVESEFARFKLWCRTKFAYTRATAGPSEISKRENIKRKLVEYIFYTNVGRKMSDVMLAVRHASK